VVNLLSTRVFGRLDLTESKTYTLSQPSKDLVKKLPDYLTIKAFISPDLPPQLKAVDRYVRDLIDEYRVASNGKLRWEAIEPQPDSDKEKNKKLEEEANRCKVQKVQVQAVHGQKFEVGAYYLGICLEYGTQIESIPQVAGPEGLEYEITSLIKRMTQHKRKVAFTTGHGESDVNQGFQALKQALERNYDITTVNPSSAEIGKDVDALVVGGPKQAFDEKGAKEIDKFVMSGKGVVFMIDGMAMTSPGGGHGMEQMQIKMAQANDTGLDKLLEGYGFKVGKNFVFDQQAMPGLLEVGGRKMLANAPCFVGAETDKATDLSVLEGIRGLVFPFASDVSLTGPLASGKPAAPGAKLWRLAASSKESWKFSDFFVLGQDPRALQKTFEPKTAERGPYAFGYAYLGPLRSAFAPPAPANESAPPQPGVETPKPVRVVVVGDSDFANDEYVQLARMFQVYQAGAELLFNAIGWTVEDEALTPLRSKTLAPRPIKLSSERAGTILQVANMLGVPVAFCIFGVVLWRVRRLRRTGQKL
jgi:ABC-2 type transport system permease protein